MKLIDFFLVKKHTMYSKIGQDFSTVLLMVYFTFGAGTGTVTVTCQKSGTGP
jgi:hypothetical protein